jgi:transcription elongation factor Elf1
MFNKGYYCIKCGPMPIATRRTRKGETVFTCPTCGQVVTEWERALNERDGRCSNCGNGSFKLKIKNDVLIRVCKKCSEEFDTRIQKVIKKGCTDGESIPNSNAN